MGRVSSLWAVIALLGACSASAPPPILEPVAAPLPPSEAEALVRPEQRPEVVVPENDASPAPAAVPSASSEALRERYANMVQRRVSDGLLRRETAPIDSPVTDTLLARNFEAIAFSSEHQLDISGAATARESSPLGRWEGPVLVELVLGDSLSDATRVAVRGETEQTVRQLAQATGHPVRMVTSGGNFKVLVLSEDDRAASASSFSELVRGTPISVARLLRTPPAQARCLVVGLSYPGSGRQNYTGAVALIRAELPGVLRFACLQEELAQGLGLPDDSPMARPSIFNDDDEFAVLTQHDLWLLRILYDPRLSSGQSREDAMPTVRRIAAELTGNLSG